MYKGTVMPQFEVGLVSCNLHASKQRHLEQSALSCFANLAGLRTEDLNTKPPEYVAELLPTRLQH